MTPAIPSSSISATSGWFNVRTSPIFPGGCGAGAGGAGLRLCDRLQLPWWSRQHPLACSVRQQRPLDFAATIDRSEPPGSHLGYERLEGGAVLRAPWEEWADRDWRGRIQ